MYTVAAETVDILTNALVSVIKNHGEVLDFVETTASWELALYFVIASWNFGSKTFETNFDEQLGILQFPLWETLWKANMDFLW